MSCSCVKPEPDPGHPKPLDRGAALLEDPIYAKLFCLFNELLCLKKKSIQFLYASAVSAFRPH